MRLTKRQLKRIIKEEKAKLVEANYYDGIPEQHMADEETIEIIAMRIQRSSRMPEQAAVNLAIGILGELKKAGIC